MPTGISPPSEFSGADRSRSSPEQPKVPAVSRIPAASTILVPRRASGSNPPPQHNPQAESSDTSMEGRGRPRQRAPHGPGPSCSSSGYPQDIP